MTIRNSVIGKRSGFGWLLRTAFIGVALVILSGCATNGSAPQPKDTEGVARAHRPGYMR